MFARLLVIVIAAGSTALGVLTLRQQQLRAGHELAQARLELMRTEERIRRVRAEIAERTSPENVRLLGDVLGELVPARELQGAPEVREPLQQTQASALDAT